MLNYSQKSRFLPYAVISGLTFKIDIGRAVPTVPWSENCLNRTNSSSLSSSASSSILSVEFLSGMLLFLLAPLCINVMEYAY